MGGATLYISVIFDKQKITMWSWNYVLKKRKRKRHDGLTVQKVERKKLCKYALAITVVINVCHYCAFLHKSIMDVLCHLLS